MSDSGTKDTPEKTLHDIDRDINKIWRELQELDTLPGRQGSRISPMRGTVLPPLSMTATPVKIRTYTTPAPTSVTAGASSTTVNASTSAPTSLPPSRTASPYKSSTPSRATVTSTLSARPPTHVYTPRRDLEPTRPGTITPAYSSSVPHKITKVTNGQQSSVDNGNNNNNENRPASTVLQQHMKEVPTKSEDFSNNNRENKVEFYPRFETRPRVASLTNKANDETDNRVEQIESKLDAIESAGSSNINSNSSLQNRNYVDKACQTEKKMGGSKSSANKCNIQ